MNTNIINPEFVIRGAGGKKITYGDGAHSRDLQEKGLLPEGTEERPAHHIILPITLTESAVLELLKQGISQEDIVNWAGVMSKAPNGIPSIHALWGPAAKTKLKIAVAMETFSKSNTLIMRLIEKMTLNNITVIETNKAEHDSKMATIQGLINLWLVIAGDTHTPELQTKLLQDWKTPIGTVVDMVHANPFAELVIKNFTESLSSHGYNISEALEAAIDKNLTSEDLEKFGTPNSERVIDFVSRETGKIFISASSIQEVQKNLNTRGHLFLAEKIKEIRK